MVDKIVPRIFSHTAVENLNPGESLTRRATGKKIKLSAPQSKAPHHMPPRKLADVLLPNGDALVIGFVRLDRQAIDFNGADDVKPRLPQAQGEAAATRE